MGSLATSGSVRSRKWVAWSTNANATPITLAGRRTETGRSSTKPSMAYYRSQYRQEQCAIKVLATRRACTMQQSVQIRRRIGLMNNGCTTRCFEESKRKLIKSAGLTIPLPIFGHLAPTILACQLQIQMSLVPAASMDTMSSWRKQSNTSRLVSTLHESAICDSSSAIRAMTSCKDES